MAGRKLGFGSLFSLVLIIILTDSADAFTPADNYLIDCGSLTDTNVSGRVFVADTGHSWTLTTPKDIVTNISNPNSVSSLISSILYLNARVFNESSAYSFPIKQQGRHFIRLYFFPFDNQQFKLTTAQFSVSTQDNTLLTNFQPRPDSTTSFKEFSANINHDNLILSFIPANNSVAFVSALEVVPVPDNLFLDTARNVNTQQPYQGLLTQVLETVYRLNMGGPMVLPGDDTLWRTWGTDGEFLITPLLAKNVSYTGIISYWDGVLGPEIAPSIVYSTATELASQSSTLDAHSIVTWQLNVDSGFSYLVRMHFCDIVSKALNNLYFSSYINIWSASNNIDLSTMSANTLHTALFMDFVAKVPSGSNSLSVSIGPSNIDGVAPDGILNGLEVMKISSSGPGAVEPSSQSKIGVILGAVCGILAVMIVPVVVSCLLKGRKKAKKQQSKTWLPSPINGGTSQSLASRTLNITTGTSGMNGNLANRLSFVVLQEATNNFDENWVIGVGGFGKVYKGTLRGETKVAVKRRKPNSQQGLIEFRTEIELLSRLRHRHLVSLIGYCDEGNEMILVYEYMEKGTLKSHLYGSDLPNLNWLQRLEICIGSARGLHYLHTGSIRVIIHRDVKSLNILLDENLMAKVADFGLSKIIPELDETHVTTAVKGTFGYMDPEYLLRQQLTEKSDVYSFGVVLLEVLCARPVRDDTLPNERVNLAQWGMEWPKRGDLGQIVDARIAGTIKPDSLRKFAETVGKCLTGSGVNRPTMGDVLSNLENALQLQKQIP